MQPSARRFHCAGCHCPVLIGSHCDRGNRYCRNGCALEARRESTRRAAKQYAKTRQGRLNNAARQRRFRERQQQKVTHQGSEAEGANAVLPVVATDEVSVVNTVLKPPAIAHCCHRCRRICDPFLRRDFLHRPSRVREPHWLWC